MAHPDLSVAAYLLAERAASGEKHEYIDGIVRACAPQGDAHATILLNLARHLDAALRDTGHAVFAADMRVQLSPTCIVYPDVAVSLTDSLRQGDDPMLHPLLAIEVFTPESVAYDLGQKAYQYRACPTLQEYVLIDCERPFVHVQRRTADGKHWEMRDFRGNEAVELRCLTLTLAIEDIYRNVDA